MIVRVESDAGGNHALSKILAFANEHKIPIVAKALGNHQEETWEIFRSAGVHVVTEVATEKAVARLFELVGTA